MPVTADMKDKLQQLADLHHYGNVSELVRVWIEKLIAQESKDHE